MTPEEVESRHEELDEMFDGDSDVSGGVDDMSLAEVRRTQSSDQSTLDSFTSDGTTYLGIVNYVNGELDDVIDDNDERLAPPRQLFHQWRQQRDEFATDVDEAVAHNRAYEEVKYNRRFDLYLQKNAGARNALAELTSRIIDGEHVVLVCYCADGRLCHRKQVRSELDRWIEVGGDEHTNDESTNQADLASLDEF